MSVGVTYSTVRGGYHIYGEKQVDDLVEHAAVLSLEVDVGGDAALARGAAGGVAAEPAPRRGLARIRVAERAQPGPQLAVGTDAAPRLPEVHGQAHTFATGEPPLPVDRPDVAHDAPATGQTRDQRGGPGRVGEPVSDRETRPAPYPFPGRDRPARGPQIVEANAVTGLVEAAEQGREPAADSCLAGSHRSDEIDVAQVAHERRIQKRRGRPQGGAASSRVETAAREP